MTRRHALLSHPVQPHHRAGGRDRQGEVDLRSPSSTASALTATTSRAAGCALRVDPGLAPGQPCRKTLYEATLDGRLIAVDAETGNGLRRFRNGRPGLAQDRHQPGFGNRPRDSRRVPLYFGRRPWWARGGGGLGHQRQRPRPDAPGWSAVITRARALWSGRGIRSRATPPTPPAPPGRMAPIAPARPMSGARSRPTRPRPGFSAPTSPSPDFFGGERQERICMPTPWSPCALHRQVVWAFQVVHHNLWDYDLPSGALADRGGARRQTHCGAGPGHQDGPPVHPRSRHRPPVLPVEERPVPQDGVPGEWLSLRQPFPVATPRWSPTAWSRRMPGA